MADFTWEAMAPILSAHWRGEASAQRWFTTHYRALGALLSGYARRAGRGVEPEELAADALGRLWEKVCQGEGLPTPEPLGNAQAFLRSVLRHLVVDAARRRSRKLDRAPKVYLDAPLEDGRAPELPDPGADAEGRLDDQRRVHRLVEALSDPKLPAHHALALLLVESAVHVDRPLVGRAAASTAAGSGLRRTAEETWRLVERWSASLMQDATLDDHGVTSWMLRTTHPGPPSGWAAEAPDDARRARDTIYQWVRRARVRLAQLLLKETP